MNKLNIYGVTIMIIVIIIIIVIIMMCENIIELVYLCSFASLILGRPLTE